eukprot:scaffold138381_cov36-Tisochrysis_lutea.AAC.3
MSDDLGKGGVKGGAAVIKGCWQCAHSSALPSMCRGCIGGHLVNAEDAELIASMRAGLLTEAGGVSRVAERQLRARQPLIVVVGADGLLRGGDEILVLRRARNFVELLVEVGKLSHLGHQRLVHHKRGLEQRCAT